MTNRCKVKQSHVVAIFKSELKMRLSNWKEVALLKNMGRQSVLQMLATYQTALRKATRGRGKPHHLATSPVMVSFKFILSSGDATVSWISLTSAQKKKVFSSLHMLKYHFIF